MKEIEKVIITESEYKELLGFFEEEVHSAAILTAIPLVVAGAIYFVSGMNPDTGSLIIVYALRLFEVSLLFLGIMAIYLIYTLIVAHRFKVGKFKIVNSTRVNRIANYSKGELKDKSFLVLKIFTYRVAFRLNSVENKRLDTE